MSETLDAQAMGARVRPPRPGRNFLQSISAADLWVGEQFTLYGALRKCRWRHWRSALAELFITLVFALLPLWVPLIAIPMFGKEEPTISATLAGQIKNGELYILAAGLLTPIYYFTFPQARDSIKTKFTPFPSQQLIILLFIFTIIIAVLAVAATKVQALANGIKPQMILISVYLFLFCTVAFLITLAVRNSLPEVAEQAYDDQSRREQREIPPPDAPPDAGTVDPERLVADVLRDHVVQGPADA